MENENYTSRRPIECASKNYYTAQWPTSQARLPSIDRLVCTYKTSIQLLKNRLGPGSFLFEIDVLKSVEINF